MKLSDEQIEAVVQWMNTWEQLKGTSIPVRFREDFKDYPKWEDKNDLWYQFMCERIDFQLKTKRDGK